MNDADQREDDPGGTDAIVRAIHLRAPVERVWRAVSDHREFGRWFGVELDGPFRAGEATTGRVTTPGYEGLPWRVWVMVVEPPARLAFTWHPYDVDPAVDLSAEPTTTVEFRLEEDGDGTRLTITESGFDAIPDPRRFEAFRRNSGGWDAQSENVARYLDV